MNTELKSMLSRMLNCETINVPKSLFGRCRRVEKLIYRAEPHGKRMNCREVAVIVEQWQREKWGEIDAV